MLLVVITLIATTNLAVGYVLGARGAFDPVMERLPRLPKRSPKADSELDLAIDEEPLTAPPPEDEQEPPEEPEAVAVAPTPAPTPAENTNDVMGGLATFRDKLSAASVELKLSREDPKRFDKCATKLQAVNHDYLESVGAAVERLDELDSEGDRTAAAARNAVSEGASGVEEMSGEIDAMIEKGLDDESRDKLIETSLSIRNAAAATGTAADEAIAKAEEAAESAAEASEPDTPEPDADNDTPKPAAAAKVATAPTVDAIFDQLENTLNAMDDDAEVLIAEVRPDPFDGVEDVAAMEKAILDQLASTTAEMLGETQTLHAGDRFVMLLAGERFDEAAQRMERLRQQMHAIDYQAGGDSHKATVTCGLVEAHRGEDRAALEARLAEALDESGRLGANRTFHHDGAFPTPIPEMPTAMSPRTVKIGS